MHGRCRSQGQNEAAERDSAVGRVHDPNASIVADGYPLARITSKAGTKTTGS
jgi:hypothetical protein